MQLGNRKRFFRPKVVMSIHGYMSTGKWQTLLTKVLEEKDIISKEFKYGFTIRFDRGKVNNLVEKFHDWYWAEVKDPANGLEVNKPFHRPSIVAHSLGTWIIVKAMEKYPEMKFDKVFLHGSIVPQDFDWYSLILSDKVNRVIVERSAKDTVVPWGVFFTGSLFPCCKYGFVQETTFIKYEDVRNFRHSDFQYTQRFVHQMERHLFDEPVQVEVVEGRDLNMAQLTKYFKQTLLIDRDAYGEDYWENSPVTIELAQEWALVEKNIWSFLIDSYTKKVIGYINTVAVDDGTFEKFVSGSISEGDIKTSMLRSFNGGGKLNIIIMSIALNSSTRKKYGGLMGCKPGELLVIALSKKIVDINSHSHQLYRIGSIAWSGAGENLCSCFGLNKTSFSFQHHPIYCASVEELRNKDMKDVHALSRWWLKKI